MKKFSTVWYNKLFTRLNDPLRDYHNHIHFGAGKLGLGLVVPTFAAAACRIIVIQRLGGEWLKLKSSQTVSLHVNDRKILNFDVVYDSPPQNLIDAKWQSGNHLLVCSDDAALKKMFIGRADSMSTALKNGLQDVHDLLRSSCSCREKKVYLYPFENARADVDLLEDSMNAVDNLQIKRVVVDKICGARKIETTRISINAESYEEIIILDEDMAAKNLLRSDTGITFVDSKREYDFHHRKKSYMLNVIHMMTAVHGYSYLIKKNIPPEDAGSYDLSVLLDMKEMKEDAELFIEIQAVRLILERPVIVRKIYSGAPDEQIWRSLLEYGADAMNRFQSTNDRLDRILSVKDLKKKYEAMLTAMISFVEDNARSVKGFDFIGPDRYELMLRGVNKIYKMLVEILFALPTLR